MSEGSLKMKKEFKILVINPGSTSTKIGVFQDEKLLFEEVLRHSTEEISKYERTYDQYAFRRDIIVETLKKNNIPLKSLDCIVGRGGMLKPVEGGTYEINEAMIEDLKVGVQGDHASNLGGIIAKEIGTEIGVPSYVVDPVTVDEMEDIARISGLAEIKRRSIVHALNHKAIARKWAKENGKKYEEANLIIAHLGGGISVGAHKNGKIIDVFNALYGDGAFSPERSGGLPVGDLVKLCYSGKYSHSDMKKMIKGKGGIVSYLGTQDVREVKKMIEKGDKKAELIYNAMAYQVAKDIGACAAVLKGEVDGILLTGGIAHDSDFTALIEERVKFISKVYVYPGEDELDALALGGLRVLRGEEMAKVYK
jgi:butyrate kinase